ncbi:MAG: hypothetical protein Unbinned4388contig1000_45 [Prokaryotic dsDNA virus sp.]|nr:MAG: hypothetical protein Unbinned4388contig1000_45 [Prokaryotic dsDNA virus sp.]|tara:strand:- start:61789 stop:62001 length:213 start_codon:yes stop_codon:yes gene_type:complete
MKKVIFLVLAGAMGVSCTKQVCVTCKEVNDRFTPQYYCGEPSEAKQFEKDVKENDGFVEQEWVCNKQKFK